MAAEDDRDALLADVRRTLESAGFDLVLPDRAEAGLRLRREADAVVVTWEPGCKLTPGERHPEHEGMRSALRHALTAILAQTEQATSRCTDIGTLAQRLAGTADREQRGGVSQSQGHHQPLHRVTLRTLPPPPLQIPDRPGRQPGGLGKLLLRQPPGLAHSSNISPNAVTRPPPHCPGLRDDPTRPSRGPSAETTAMRRSPASTYR